MKKKKIAASFIAISTSAAIVITTVLSNDVQETYAQESFSGIEEIIEGKEYKILEIVPDMSMAKMGLLVNGQESYYDEDSDSSGSLETILSGMRTAQQRKEYMTGLFNAYSAIISTTAGTDNVLVKSEYDESYIQVEGYKELELSSTVYLDPDEGELDGYYMIDVGENGGQYVLEPEYKVAVDKTDKSLYSQNVSFYDVGTDAKYYNVYFTSSGSDGSGSGAYQPLTGENISEDDWNAMEVGDLFYFYNANSDTFTLCQKGEEVKDNSGNQGGTGDKGESGESGETEGSNETEESGETGTPEETGETDATVEDNSGNQDGAGDKGESGESGEPEESSETEESGETGTPEETGETDATVEDNSGNQGGTGDQGESGESGESEGSNETEESGETGTPEETGETDATVEDNSGNQDGAGDKGESGESGETEGSNETEESGETEESSETGTPEETEEPDTTVTDNGITVISEFQSSLFYNILFQYVTSENIQEGENYYTPYIISVSYDASGNGTGSYGAVLDSSEPYYLDPNGFFEQDTDNMYYMKSENGQYELTKSEEGAIEIENMVEIDSIYYTGGLTSNDYFKTYVFNQSSLLDNEGVEFNVTVKTVLPGDVTMDMANEYDMIYLSNSFAYNLKLDPNTYSAENDLLGSIASIIYSLASEDSSYKPVIVDAGILSSVAQDTNIYKLARLLSSDDMEMNSADYEDGNWTVEYGTCFIDEDSYFVNGNILSVPEDGREFSFLLDFGKAFIEQQESGHTENKNYSSESEQAFNTMAKEAGFGEVSATIVNENFIRESENQSADNKDKYTYFELCISRAICVEYIITYVSKRETESLDEIKVLDIEPCTITKSVSGNTSTIIENQILALLGSEYTDKIKITHMTTAELISKVEDINKYDLIYMGLYTDSMNSQSKTYNYLKSDTSMQYALYSTTGLKNNEYTANTTVITAYNDNDMNGLIYTNIGDTQTTSAFAGLFDTDYNLTGGMYQSFYKDANGIWQYSSDKKSSFSNNVRYSGNDITDEKLEELISYAKSASPIILADNFLTERIEDGKTVTVVNDKQYYYTYNSSTKEYSITDKYFNGAIDNCSNMYELIDKIAVKNTYRNVKTLSDWKQNKELLNNYLTMGKPQLIVNEQSTVTEDVEYVATSNDKITIDFSVKTYGSVETISSFNVDLYIDFNADGRYSKTTEKIDANSFNIYLIDQATGAENRMYPSTVNDETTGEETTYYSISSLNGKKSTEVYYRLEYAVQKDYEGIYPVKLVVSQENNEYRYSYWSGYYYHAKTTGSDEAVTIKVLQILPEHLWETRSHSLFDMDLTGSYETGSETKNTNYAPLFANKYINHNASTFYRKYYYDRNTGKATSDLCDVTSEYADSWTDNVTITDSNYENINKGRWNAVINSFKSSNFYKLAFDKSSTENKLSGYDLEIDSVYSDSLANYFTEGTGTSADPYTFDMEDYQNFLNYYDMLIIGFGDYVQYFSNYNTYTIASSKIKNELLHPKEDHDNECRRNETIKDTVNLQTNLVDYYYAGIHNYIASGKSVLFTHDTTVSNTNDEIVQNGDVDWSSGLFSDLLAGDVGFDRYGIYDNDDSLLSLVLSAGISDVTKESTVSLSVSSYPSLKLAMAKISELYEESGNDTTKSYGLNGTEATITSGQLYNIIVGEAEKENKDVAYKPNSNKTVLTAEVQGKSSIAINQQGSSQYISFLTQNENGKVTTFDNRKISTTWSDTVTTAEVINQGQILVYPYNVCSDLTYTDENGENGILTISATHMQYFQIDMNADEDQDGESDVTVWLTLRDKATADIMYDVAKRDARNNYYIYTKGNVTYSGVGHDSINSWGDNTSTSEIKLYINTMIVAYQASAQDPEITIKESADTTSADKDTIYVSVDASIDDEGVVSTTTTTDGVEKLNTIEDISMSTTISSEKWNAKVTEDSGASTYERMYVYVQDTNVLRNAEKNIKLSYYLILDDEYSGLDKDAVTAKLSGTVLANFSSLVTDISGLSSSSGGTHVWAIPLSLSTYSISYDANGKQKTKAFDADEDSAVSGRMYCVDVPYYLIGDSTRAEVRCYVTTTVTKNGTQVSKKSGYDTVYLQQLSLFDLQ